VRSKSKSGGNGFLKVSSDEVAPTESDTKGSGSVDSEKKNGVQSGAEVREEILEDDVTLRLDVEAQKESREGHRREPSPIIIKTVQWEVVSETATLPGPALEELQGE
jgi:hypothetical protein